MKTFEVLLTKSFSVLIQAEDKIKAQEFSEFFTSDVQNLASTEDERKYNFKIAEIECKFNEAIEVNELYENN